MPVFPINPALRATSARVLGLAALLALKALVLSPPSASAQVVTVTGAVVDSMTGTPLKGAMVYVLSGGQTLTDDQGRFLLRNVNLARDLLLVRRVGYVPRANRIAQHTGETEVDIGSLPLQPLAVVLDSIQVQTDLVARNSKLADFYHRRAFSQGSFFTRKQIAERNPRVVSDLLRTLPGIIIACEGLGSCVPATARRSGLEPQKGYCKLQLIVDGMPTGIIPDDIPPAWIAGIEVYKGSAQGPAQFGATGKSSGSTRFDPYSMSQGPPELSNPFCGTVAIWTGGDRE